MISPLPQTLPTKVRPLRYNLTLEPDLVEFSFLGEETIDVEVSSTTKTIEMNCDEIEVLSCQLIPSIGGILIPKDIVYDKSKETVTFKFECSIPLGEAQLSIRFTGSLNDRLRGFYRSHYKDDNGQEKTLATTQFESTDARRAFPCWDEPKIKATFKVTLVIPSDLMAISNMPATDETITPTGIKSVQFAETPVMSTYLLAFIVGDLKAIEQTTDSGTLVRVWATRGKELQGQFALEVSTRLLTYLNDYFDIPYPLPKLDHIAIPDFAAGAMENWGAITYRETALLVDPENSSAGTRQVVASIIAHEMAHMWFGNLVTMSWWNDLWLNESFASWVGDKAVDHLFPDWEIWTQFLYGDTASALNLDGLTTSHPIEQEVTNPAEIGQLFDAISYSKGASILRMLEQYLTEDLFRKGLRLYLVKNQYSNAQTKDLWSALGEVSGQPVEDVMNTWVKQTGYPVLELQISRHDQGIDIAVSQSRFVYEKKPDQKTTDDSLWCIPFSVRTATNPQSTSFLMDAKKTLTRIHPTDYESVEEWIKVNPVQTGFYRVKYSAEELTRLVTPIKNLVLTAPDRLGIQNDAHALAMGGYIPAIQFLDISRAYSNESDPSVCGELASNFLELDGLLWGQPYYKQFQTFVRNIFQPIGQRIGWDSRLGEGHLQTLLRSTVMMQLGIHGDQEILKEAHKRFISYLKDSGNVNPDIRRVVLNLAAKNGDRSTYDNIWNLRSQTSLQEERVRLQGSLSFFQQPKLLEETLSRSLTNEVRMHETIAIITSVAANHIGRDLAWEFLKSNWRELHRRYGEGGFGLMRLVSITAHFTTMEMHQDVEAFFRDNQAPSAERSILQSLEKIKLNAAYREHNNKQLAAWFGRM